MPIIYSYPQSTDLLKSDILIGSSTRNVNGQKKNVTKNFSLESVYTFLNETNAIAIAGQNNFFFQNNIAPIRQQGSISFVAGGGANTPFSNITTLRFSKYSTSGNIVIDYLETLVGNNVILAQTDNLNNFGIYVLDSLTQVVGSPNFYDASFTLVTANGNITADKFYGFAFYSEAGGGGAVETVTGNIVDNTDPLNPVVTQVQPDWDAVSGLGEILNKPTIPTKTSDLTNDGENGVYPFVTTADLANVGIQEVLNNGNTVSDDTPIIYSDNAIASSYYANGELGFTNTSDGSTNIFSISGIRHQTSNLSNFTQVSFVAPTSGRSILFPNNSGTVALLSDIPAVTGYVPYTGATQNVDLGEYELKAGQMTLDVSPTGTATVGTTRWNNTIGSSETTLKGGSVILKNGVDLVARVVNKVTPNTTLTKANYPAVRVTGAQGQRLAVAYAQANNDNNSADTIGLVCETIATNQEGFIITVGQLEEINTTGSLQGETWADGDVLYLSPTTAGSLTNVKPTGATGHIVVIGYVEYSHAIHGKIYVKVMNGWELDELHNVYINTPLNNQVLTYNSTSQLWENESVKTLDGLSLMANADLSYFNQWSFEQNFGYITPNVGNTTYTGIRTTNSNSQTGQTADFTYPARMLYASATTLAAFATQRGTVGGNFIQSFNLKLYWKRRFQIDCNISGSRFVCGLSNMFQLASPTNVEPDTLINTIGVCKLSTSNNLHFFWNDATGLATTVDLGVNYPANNVTAYFYDLEIYKESGTANITLKLTRIDASGNRISTLQVVSTNYNSGITHSPVIYGTNNATASSFRFYDYGIIFKHYNLGWDTI
jgi:nitrogen fixation protein